MLTRNNIKEITCLRAKKDRYEKQLFFAEGEKLVDDLLHSSLNIKGVYYTTKSKLKTTGKATEWVEVDTEEMRKISKLSTPTPVLALVEMPAYNISEVDFSHSLTLALDDIQDPGNMGTIIRLADWFGVDTILCSNDTVDAYSPKVIQACMGSIARVKVIYCDLPEVIKGFSNFIKLPVYGTFMEGSNVYREKLNSSGLILMGNEGNGIRKELIPLVNHKIHIPNFATKRLHAESLNVAMATAVVLSEFRRRFSG